jgi:signal transduction histidine kinase
MTPELSRRDYNPAMKLSLPPHSRWIPPWTDIALACAALAGFIAVEPHEISGQRLAGMLLMALPLAGRRIEPTLMFCLVVVGAFNAISSEQIVGFACIIIAGYSVGAYSPYRYESLAVLVGVAIYVAKYAGDSAPQLPGWAFPFLLLLPLWMVGVTVRSLRERVDASVERATRLEREAELATQQALSEERSRIARELHDVVAHSVSVMVVQAGAARQVLLSSPDEARESLLAVESTGREAMAELRNFLGVLNDDDAPALAPQPGIEQIGSLVQRVRDAGLPVQMHVAGEVRPLAVGVDLTAYRVVQEALTNALRHSGLAPTEVMLDYRETELKVEVLDDGESPTPSTAGAGRGLAGMRDRVALYGGTLEAGPRLGRGYAVRAWLPLARAAE